MTRKLVSFRVNLIKKKTAMISGKSTHNQRIEDFGMTLLKVLAVFNMFFNIKDENSTDLLNKKKNS